MTGNNHIMFTTLFMSSSTTTTTTSNSHRTYDENDTCFANNNNNVVQPQGKSAMKKNDNDNDRCEQRQCLKLKQQRNKRQRQTKMTRSLLSNNAIYYMILWIVVIALLLFETTYTSNIGVGIGIGGGIGISGVIVSVVDAAEYTRNTIQNKRSLRGTRDTSERTSYDDHDSTDDESMILNAIVQNDDEQRILRGAAGTEQRRLQETPYNYDEQMTMMYQNDIDSFVKHNSDRVLMRPEMTSFMGPGRGNRNQLKTGRPGIVKPNNNGLEPLNSFQFQAAINSKVNNDNGVVNVHPPVETEQEEQPLPPPPEIAADVNDNTSNIVTVKNVNPYASFHPSPKHEEPKEDPIIMTNELTLERSQIENGGGGGEPLTHDGTTGTLTPDVAQDANHYVEPNNHSESAEVKEFHFHSDGQPLIDVNTNNDSNEGRPLYFKTEEAPMTAGEDNVIYASFHPVHPSTTTVQQQQSSPQEQQGDEFIKEEERSSHSSTTSIPCNSTTTTQEDVVEPQPLATSSTIPTHPDGTPLEDTEPYPYRPPTGGANPIKYDRTTGEVIEKYHPDGTLLEDTEPIPYIPPDKKQTKVDDIFFTEDEEDAEPKTKQDYLISEEPSLEDGEDPISEKLLQDRSTYTTGAPPSSTEDPTTSSGTGTTTTPPKDNSFLLKLVEEAKANKEKQGNEDEGGVTTTETHHHQTTTPVIIIKNDEAPMEQDTTTSKEEGTAVTTPPIITNTPQSIKVLDDAKVGGDDPITELLLESRAATFELSQKKPAVIIPLLNQCQIQRLSTSECKELIDIRLQELRNEAGLGEDKYYVPGNESGERSGADNGGNDNKQEDSSSSTIPTADPKVVVVHPRLSTDVGYHEIVIPVDYAGRVLGNHLDFIVRYPFEWHGAPRSTNHPGFGSRKIGPFDCKGMSGVQCCNLILAEVFDKDVQGNFLDCWLSEGFYSDRESGEMIQVYVDDDQTIKPVPNDEKRLRKFEVREQAFRTVLVEELQTLILSEKVDRQIYSKWTVAIRHALRGFPMCHGIDYILKLPLRGHYAHKEPETGNILLGQDPETLHALERAITCLERLTEQGGLHRLGGITEGSHRDVILLKQALKEQDVVDVVQSASYLDLTEQQPKR